MATTYERCGPEVTKMAHEVMKKWHPDLVKTEARVAFLFARNPGGDAVTVGGYPCAARVRVVPLIQRADGRADAEVTIDVGEWAVATDPQREALLDHELHHLEVTWESLLVWKTDDLGRPKLKLRKHDHQFGWFDTIAVRHGDASYEVKQAKAFADRNGQLYFGWSSPPADGGMEHKPAPVPPDVTKAVADLCPKPGSGITSVTLSTGGTSVTLTQEDAKRLRKGKRDADAGVVSAG